MSYERHIRCLCCGNPQEAGHGASFHNKFESLKFCWKCGSKEGWRDSVDFWVPLWTWFNPISWGDGFWQEKSD